MAVVTHYVSTTGSDATPDGTDPLQPYLHLHNAIIGAVDGDDLTLSIANGSYREDGTNSYLFVSKPLTTLNFSPENDGQVTVTAIASGGQSRVMHFQAPPTNVTIGVLTVDAEGVQSGCVTVDNSSNLNALTINGTTLRNSTDVFVSGTALANLTMTGGWSIEMIAASQKCVNVSNTGGAGTYLVENGSAVLASSAINGSLFRFNANIAGQTVELSDNLVNGTIGSSNPSDGLALCRGVQNVTYLRNTVTLSGANITFEGMIVSASATLLCDSVLAEANNLNFGTNQADIALYGIKIGEEGSPNRDRISSVSVNRNTVIGADHAYMFGYITNAKSAGNYGEAGLIGCLNKGTTTCEWTGNVMVDMSTKSLYAKGDTNSRFSNNTAIAKTVSPVSAFLFTDADDLEVFPSTGTIYTNNIAYSEVAFVKYASCEVGSTSNYNNNCFYSTVAEPAEPYGYLGTGYATLALWQAAVDATPESAANNVNVDPLFVNAASGNYRLQSGSTLVGTGLKWWGNNPRPSGVDGEPYPDTQIDIGGYQSTFDPNHPKNL